MKKQGVFTILLFMMVNSLFSQLKSSNTLLDTKINLTLKEVSIEHVLDTLHKVYDLNFSYINNDIPLERIVNLNFKHESLDKVLKHILKGTNVKYYQVSSQIVLRLENTVDPTPRSMSI